MIQDVKNLRAKLHVKCFGDFPDVIVFEHREVQVGYSGTNQDVSTGITTQIEALQQCGVALSGIAIRIIESLIWRRRNPKALSLDVIARIAWIRKRSAARAGKAVWVIPRIAAV